MLVFKKTKENWEVLNGVGVDGVGGIFPFFFFASLRFSLLFLKKNHFAPRNLKIPTLLNCSRLFHLPFGNLVTLQQSLVNFRQLSQYNEILVKSSHL